MVVSSKGTGWGRPKAEEVVGGKSWVQFTYTWQATKRAAFGLCMHVCVCVCVCV